MQKTEQKNNLPRFWKLLPVAILFLLGICAAWLGAVYIVFAGRILPNIYFKNVALGGLTEQEARGKLQNSLGVFNEKDLKISINAKKYAITPHAIGFPEDRAGIARRAISVGRDQKLWLAIWETALSPFISKDIAADIRLFDSGKLRQQIAAMAQAVDIPVRDIRLEIIGTNVKILTDTRAGKKLNQEYVFQKLIQNIQRLDFSPVDFSMDAVYPNVSIDSAENAKIEAEQIINGKIVLKHKDNTIEALPEVIGSWIISEPHGRKLAVKPNEQKISKYVEEIAKKFDTEIRNTKIQIEDSRVIDFVPPRQGLTTEQDKAAKEIIALLERRKASSQAGTEAQNEIQLPVRTVFPTITNENENFADIKELIGKATTSFAGSSKTRISNIKNGVKFLNGLIIRPSEEFSTVKKLGQVDNTTGYFPELVIKENHTIPEFGGGLCQVSTTLFRAVLNVGLPVTKRQNHSYRVSYYEKDGDGKYVGPGLDATIYEPSPDFRFINDTDSNILLWGQIIDDKITFEFYGTKDGRTSQIIGPKKLSQTPYGPAIYSETDTLPKGAVKQTEKPRNGATAVATYRILYPNGEIKEQVFRSSYKPWPAQYLVGTGAEAKNPKTQ